jgi:hypothetical protein
MKTCYYCKGPLPCRTLAIPTSATVPSCDPRRSGGHEEASGRSPYHGDGRGSWCRSQGSAVPPYQSQRVAQPPRPVVPPPQQRPQLTYEQ